MAGSTDDNHSGIGYEKAGQLLDTGEAIETKSSFEESEPKPENQSSSSAQENPAFSSPEAKSKQSYSREQSEPESDDESEPCPHCGEEIDNWGEISHGEIRKCGSCGGRFKKR
jgi:hypothetical protein